MVSNRLTHRRTTISNPKICKSKLKPLRPLPPEPPPQWPPPYINARISALVYGQQFEATLTLEPRDPDPPITYVAFDLTLYLYLILILYTTETQNQIVFSEVYHGYPPYFWATQGPTVPVQPPTFSLQNSQWLSQSPYGATIQVAIAYPHQP